MSTTEELTKMAELLIMLGELKATITLERARAEKLCVSIKELETALAAEKQRNMEYQNKFLGVNGVVISCVYCGEAYPEGTPPHGSKILTDHIKICEKHPLREAEVVILSLRSALEGLIGASTDADLKSMELMIRQSPAPDADKTAALNAIHALLDIGTRS